MTLVILAAGMGSRYGSLKQLDPFTPHGEFLTDFSSYDAYLAGFDRVIFVIKPENEELFRATVGERIEKKMDVRYAYQTDDRFVPASFTGVREKPWGTGHALLCCDGLIDGNFMMINCDDLYGRTTYERAAAHLRSVPEDSCEFAMCGFSLCNTLAQGGGVSRGICCVSDDGALVSITERVQIYEKNGEIVSDDGLSPRNFPRDAITSMNAWCFTRGILPILHDYFADFVSVLRPEEEARKEFYLPVAVDRAMKEGRCSVRVLPSGEKWFGVTYKGDKERVEAHLSELTQAGFYPSPLFR